MITIRKSNDRGHHDFGWLDTRHTFSFGRYYDPRHMGFGPLRVINEDVVAPGKGFGEHPHDNMEIISYVVSGALAHKDSTGTAQTIVPGDIQRMSAGSGIEHSEFNPSKSEPVHFLQIWLEPNAEGIDPGYAQKHFAPESKRDRLTLLASPDGAEGSITISADAKLYSTLLSPGKRVSLKLASGAKSWVQVIGGGISVNGTSLSAGDGAAIENETAIELVARDESEVLVFELN
jgi:redox-sensitive bicupin YhaK (pirin superfamily)